MFFTDLSFLIQQTCIYYPLIFLFLCCLTLTVDLYWLASLPYLSLFNCIFLNLIGAEHCCFLMNDKSNLSLSHPAQSISHLSVNIPQATMPFICLVMHSIIKFPSVSLCHLIIHTHLHSSVKRNVWKTVQVSIGLSHSLIRVGTTWAARIVLATFGGMNTIHPKDIPLVGVLLIVLESTV